jgi:hypothetical protein
MSEVHKPMLVRLVDSILCMIIGIFTWGEGLWVNTFFFFIKKDDDLVVLIRISKVAYTKEVCVTWDSKHENQGPSKTFRLKEM